MGLCIRQARESAGLTQDQVAAALGLRQQSVGKWESGISRPSTIHLGQLAKLLQTSVDELLGGARPPDDPPAIAASGELEELRRLDPAAYEQLLSQLEFMLDRARGRRR